MPDGGGRSFDTVQGELAQAERRLREAEQRAADARRAHRDRARENAENSTRGKYEDEDDERDHPDYREEDRLGQEANAAQAEANAAAADVRQLRDELGMLPTDEDILSEVGDQNPEWGGSEKARRYQVAGGFLGLTGFGLFLLAFLFPLLEPAGPGASGSPSQSPPPAGAGSPGATSPATPTPEPITAAPVTGSSEALVSFTRTGGSCPFPDEFDAAFAFEAADGTLTATQVGPVEHVSTGTIQPDGTFALAAEGQSYTGTIDGTLLSGTYTDTTSGCNDIYVLDGQLFRPFLEGPPGATAPGYFEFFGLSSGVVSIDLREMASEPRVEIIVASLTDDVTGQLPIRVVGSSGDDTLFDMVIEGAPTAVCRGPDGCSAPIDMDATWLDPGNPITIVATGSGDDVIAVHMPNGAPVTAAPTATPSAVPSPTPSPAATPTPVAAAPSASGGSQPGGTATATGGPNLPLAAGGIGLMLGGAGLGLLGPRVARGRTAGAVAVAQPVREVAASVIAADVATSPLIAGRAGKTVALERSNVGRTALYAAAAAVALLAVLGGVAYALGAFGPSTADPGATDVAAATPSPSSSSATGAATPSAAPTAAPDPDPPSEIADVGLWPDGATFAADPTGDAIYSIPDQPPGYFPGYVDQVASGATVVNAPQGVVDPAFNATTFDCSTVVDGVLTACAGTEPIAAGPLLVAAARMAEPIPQGGEDGVLTFALVLRADGDPSNDYEADAPFTDDFYQGTDRWYELVYVPETGWTLSVDRGETASNARAAVVGDLVVFFVPLAELAVDQPTYRLTSFASSDASYEPDSSGGDTSVGPPADDWGLAGVEGELEAAAGFVARLGGALASGDTGFLLERLHSATLDRYGVAACEAYVGAVVDPTNDLVPGDASGPESWDYMTDDATTVVEEAYTVITSGTLQGQAVTDAQFHVAVEDGTYRWFTDCGQPLG